VIFLWRAILLLTSNAFCDRVGSMKSKVPHGALRRPATRKHPLRVWREGAGLSLREMAKKIGENGRKTNEQYLGQIERYARHPGALLAKAIAKTVGKKSGITVEMLVIQGRREDTKRAA
jgi:DNA-binding XRE family transcriptional regulator